MHVEASQVVRAPRERVYAAYADFESWPKWSKRLKRVRIVEANGNTVSLETEAERGGRTRVSSTRLTLSEGFKSETESETKLTMTKRTVKFEDVPEGTKVTAVLDVHVKGLWSALFVPRGRAEEESTAMEGLKSFAEYVEGTLGDKA